MIAKKTSIDEKLKELFKDTSFDCYQYEGFERAQELIDHMRDEILEDEVIYYSRAMEYLSEHDASLQESMQLAADLGYMPDAINSELLATLLKQDNLSQELHDLTDEIEAIFEGGEQ